MKQVILGAPHWFLIRGEAWGVQELVVAVTGSEPVPVAGSRYGHPVPGAANTLTSCPRTFNHVMLELKQSTKPSCHRDDPNYGQRSRLTGAATRLPAAPAERCSNLSSNDAQTATINSLPSSATSKITIKLPLTTSTFQQNESPGEIAAEQTSVPYRRNCTDFTLLASANPLRRCWPPVYL